MNKKGKFEIRKAGDVEKHTGAKMVSFKGNGLSPSLGKETYVVREDVGKDFESKGQGKIVK